VVNLGKQIKQKEKCMMKNVLLHAAVLAAALVFTGCSNGTTFPGFEVTTGQLSMTNIPAAAQGKYLFVMGEGTGGAGTADLSTYSAP
jgi:predicted small secreted protein